MKGSVDGIDIRRSTDACTQAIIYSQQVTAGAKLAASLQIPSDTLPEALEAIEREGCLERHNEVDGWAYVWIYKYAYVELILDEITKRGSPKNAFDNWVNGKLFGYSDYEIGRFIEEGGYIETPS